MQDQFNSDIESILTDTDILSYFLSNKKSILHFIKTYIKVDKVLCSDSNNLDSNIIYNKLDDIKNVISNNTNEINNLSLSISNVNTMIKSIKDITNNELKSTFYDFQTQLLKENNNNNELRGIFENFKERIEIINNKKFDDLNICIKDSFEKSLSSHEMNNKICIIEKNLSNLNVSNSARKGQVAETVLFNVLTETFTDTEIKDTSHIPNSGDIQMIKDDKPNILIDSKNFGNNTVPKRDLDKFYSDIQQNNCSGILCNAFGGIANKQNFEIDIVDKNVLVFIHSHQFDPTLFKLATNIIYNMHQELREKRTDSIILDQRLYQNIKIEYNYYIQTFRHHLDIIKSNVNSLSQLSFTLLDNFFKRKATANIELKQFSCHICSSQMSTEKILKTHLKKMHSNLLSEEQNLTKTDSKKVSKKETNISSQQTNQAVSQQMNSQARQMNPQMNQQMNPQMNIQMNRQMNPQMNLQNQQIRQMNQQIIHQRSDKLDKKSLNS